MLTILYYLESEYRLSSLHLLPDQSCSCGGSLQGYMQYAFHRRGMGGRRGMGVGRGWEYREGMGGGRGWEVGGDG